MMMVATTKLLLLIYMFWTNFWTLKFYTINGLFLEITLLFGTKVAKYSSFKHGGLYSMQWLKSYKHS